jgi:hypothetical protein
LLSFFMIPVFLYTSFHLTLILFASKLLLLFVHNNHLPIHSCTVIPPCVTKRKKKRKKKKKELFRWSPFFLLELLVVIKRTCLPIGSLHVG